MQLKSYKIEIVHNRGWDSNQEYLSFLMVKIVQILDGISLRNDIYLAVP